MMCPVTSRNGNKLGAKQQSRRFAPFFCSDLTGEEVRMEVKVAFCVLVLLTGSPQAGGQSSALPPVLLSDAANSSSPDMRTEDPAGNGSSETVHTETVHTETVHSMATETVYTTNMVTAAASPSGAVDSHSSAETVQSAAPPLHTSTSDGRDFLTSHPFTTFSSQPAHTGSTAHSSTAQPQSDSLTATQPTATGHRPTSALGQGPAGPTHQEVPPELNVGDDELKGPLHRSSSPLDPLLAGLLSVFIITTAVVFVVLFLKFRQRTNHPEFHRLQDLPMDDLMEDTPLSRYTY